MNTECLQCAKHASQAAIWKEQYEKLIHAFKAFAADRDEDIALLKAALNECILTTTESVSNEM